MLIEFCVMTSFAEQHFYLPTRTIKRTCIYICLCIGFQISKLKEAPIREYKYYFFTSIKDFFTFKLIKQYLKRRITQMTQLFVSMKLRDKCLSVSWEKKFILVCYIFSANKINKRLFWIFLLLFYQQCRKSDWNSVKWISLTKLLVWKLY